MLADLVCSRCGATGLIALPNDGRPSCPACGQLAAPGQLVCAHCEALNAVSATFCGDCGERLRAACPACGADNWAGGEKCLRCGGELNLVESLARRHAEGYRGALQQQREGANAFKAAEERDSQKRMAALWEVDRQRQEALARDRARQQRSQTRLMLVVLVAGGLILLSLVLALIFTAR